MGNSNLNIDNIHTNSRNYNNINDKIIDNQYNILKINNSRMSTVSLNQFNKNKEEFSTPQKELKLENNRSHRSTIGTNSKFQISKMNENNDKISLNNSEIFECLNFDKKKLIDLTNKNSTNNQLEIELDSNNKFLLDEITFNNSLLSNELSVKKNIILDREVVKSNDKRKSIKDPKLKNEKRTLEDLERPINSNIKNENITSSKKSLNSSLSSVRNNSTNENKGSSKLKRENSIFSNKKIESSTNSSN